MEGSPLWVYVRDIEMRNRSIQMSFPYCACVKGCCRFIVQGIFTSTPPGTYSYWGPELERIWQKALLASVSVTLIICFFEILAKHQFLLWKQTAHPLRQSVLFLTKHMPNSWRGCQKRLKRICAWENKGSLMLKDKI